jgi:hypothetical protein
MMLCVVDLFGPVRLREDGVHVALHPDALVGRVGLLDAGGLKLAAQLFSDVVHDLWRRGAAWGWSSAGGGGRARGKPLTRPEKRYDKPPS